MGLVSALALVAYAAPAATPQKVTGPVATYWMSVATTSGFGAGMMGGGGRPSMGSVMGAMMGRGSRPSHSLTLQLGSTRPATGAPAADHLPGASPALALLTPRETPPAPPEEVEESQPTFERPKGRMLIYWGCGDHAGPGQPYVIDFAKIMDGQSMPRIPYIAIRYRNPPAAGRSTTYGDWPNSRSRAQPPASLVGDHVVRGNYSPDIRFTLPATRDYMPPLLLDTSGRSPAGATLLSWQPVTGALGYFATMFGSAGNGGGDATIVMWSSSAAQTFAGGGLLDYLPPSEVRRLIGQKVVLPPTATQCAVPVEVTNQAKMGMVSMIAYGDDVDFADPPRPQDPRVPWNISWTVKVRYKSTAGAMLGMSSPGAGDMDEPEVADSISASDPQQEPAKKKKKGGLGGLLRGGLGSVIP